MVVSRPVSTQEIPQTDQLDTTLHATVPLVTEKNSRIRIGWRIVLTLLLLLSLALLSLLGHPPARVSAAELAEQASAPAEQSSADPLVLAFYYTWFDENTWSYDKLSDLPAQTYVSRDRATMGRHIDEAKRAGIDAFLVAWYGPHNNQTEPNLAALLEEAAARNFKIGILFETDSPFLGSVDAVTGALQHALGTHANHPAFLRADGRPVFFFWRPTIYGVETWRGIRGAADPGYSSIWISEGVDVSWLAVFDGHHLYSNTWNPPADLVYTNQKFANWVQGQSQQFGSKLWVATVMPGYNDVRVRPGVGFAHDREGGAYFEHSWQAAISSRPNWIIITSFNEWPEGTYIEPSVAHGDHYLNLSAKWSQQFKSGGGAGLALSAPQQSVATTAAAAVAPSAPATPAVSVPVLTIPAGQNIDGPVALVEVALLNLRAGPGTDQPIVAMAKQGTALPIVDAVDGWWQIEVDEQQAWVFGEMVRTAGLSAGLRTAAASTPSQKIAPALTTVAATAAAEGAIARVDVSLLNLRSTPDTDGRVLTILEEGATLTVTGRDSAAAAEWLQVSINGQTGWVYASMVAAPALLDVPVVSNP